MDGNSGAVHCFFAGRAADADGAEYFASRALDQEAGGVVGPGAEDDVDAKGDVCPNQRRLGRIWQGG